MNLSLSPNRFAGAARLLATYVVETMSGARYPRFVRFAVVLICLIARPFPVQGQTGSVDAAIVQLNRLTSFSALPNGIEARDGDARMQIVALRDEVVRVRVSRSQAFPEDASWAVLKEAKQSSITVTPDNSPSTVGYHTQSIRVSIN